MFNVAVILLAWAAGQGLASTDVTVTVRTTRTHTVCPYPTVTIDCGEESTLDGGGGTGTTEVASSAPHAPGTWNDWDSLSSTPESSPSTRFSQGDSTWVDWPSLHSTAQISSSTRTPNDGGTWGDWPSPPSPAEGSSSTRTPDGGSTWADWPSPPSTAQSSFLRGNPNGGRTWVDWTTPTLSSSTASPYPASSGIAPIQYSLSSGSTTLEPFPLGPSSATTSPISTATLIVGTSTTTESQSPLGLSTIAWAPSRPASIPETSSWKSSALVTSSEYTSTASAILDPVDSFSSSAGPSSSSTLSSSFVPSQTSGPSSPPGPTFSPVTSSSPTFSPSRTSSFPVTPTTFSTLALGSTTFLVFTTSTPSLTSSSVTSTTTVSATGLPSVTPDTPPSPAPEDDSFYIVLTPLGAKGKHKRAQSYMGFSNTEAMVIAEEALAWPLTMSLLSQSLGISGLPGRVGVDSRTTAGPLRRSSDDGTYSPSIFVGWQVDSTTGAVSFGGSQFCTLADSTLIVYWDGILLEECSPVGMTQQPISSTSTTSSSTQTTTTTSSVTITSSSTHLAITGTISSFKSTTLVSTTIALGPSGLNSTSSPGETAVGPIGQSTTSGLTTTASPTNTFSNIPIPSTTIIPSAFSTTSQDGMSSTSTSHAAKDAHFTLTVTAINTALPPAEAFDASSALDESCNGGVDDSLCGKVVTMADWYEYDYPYTVFCGEYMLGSPSNDPVNADSFGQCLSYCDKSWDCVAMSFVSNSFCQTANCRLYADVQARWSGQSVMEGEIWDSAVLGNQQHDPALGNTTALPTYAPITGTSSLRLGASTSLPNITSQTWLPIVGATNTTTMVYPTAAANMSTSSSLPTRTSASFNSSMPTSSSFSNGTALSTSAGTMSTQTQTSTNSSSTGPTSTMTSTSPTNTLGTLCTEPAPNPTFSLITLNSTRLPDGTAAVVDPSISSPNYPFHYIVFNEGITTGTTFTIDDSGVLTDVTDGIRCGGPTISPEDQNQAGETVMCAPDSTFQDLGWNPAFCSLNCPTSGYGLPVLSCTQNALTFLSIQDGPEWLAISNWHAGDDDPATLQAVIIDGRPSSSSNSTTSTTSTTSFGASSTSVTLSSFSTTTTPAAPFRNSTTTLNVD